MNRYYYQPQQPHDYATSVPSPWGLYDNRYYYQTPVYYNSMMPMFYPQSMQYVDDMAILDTMSSYPQSIHYVDEVAILDTNQEATHSYIGQNDQYYYAPYRTSEEDTLIYTSADSLGHEFEAYLEERLMMLELEDDRNNAGRSGSGLSMEEISERLRVYAAEREASADCEVETCSICLDDCEKKEKTARLECGHRFHVDCIKRWLMSKNVCPMCRATALTV